MFLKPAHGQSHLQFRITNYSSDQSQLGVVPNRKLIGQTCHHVGCGVDIIVDDQGQIVASRTESGVYSRGSPSMTFMPEDPDASERWEVLSGQLTGAEEALNQASAQLRRA